MSTSNNAQNGKGDKPRPISDYQKFISNWDDIFKKDKKKVAKKKEMCDLK